MPKSPSRLPRFLMEALVIVGSILLAFAIDAGWETSRESEARRAALVDLRSELAESLPLIDRTLFRINKDLALMHDMLKDVDGLLARLEPSAHGEVVEAIFRPNTADDNATSINAILEDPGVRDLTDDGVRTAISSWRLFRTEVEERGSTIVNMEGPTLERLSLHSDIQELFADFTLSVGSGWSDVIRDETLRMFASDPEIRAIMARKAKQATSQRYWLVLLQTATSDLITQVDRVLGGD